jgi:hypothetical protein
MRCLPFIKRLRAAVPRAFRCAARTGRFGWPFGRTGQFGRTFGHAGRAALCLCAALSLGCGGAYRVLRPVPGDPGCVQRFKPALGSAVYNTQVDVIGKHLSGLLAIKLLPDSSTRLIFISEMGLTFFDFGFASDGHFTVYRILDQMNKKTVIKTLRKDFELILWQHTGVATGRVLSNGTDHYYAFPQEKGTNYYITDSTCTHFLRAEKASRKKAIVIAHLLDYREGIPDSVSIVHQTFHFTIALKRIHQ